MGKTSSRNVIFKRRRINAWKYLKLKNILIVVIIVLSFVALSSVASMKLLEKKAEKSTIKYAKDFVVENNNDEKKQDNQKSDNNNYSENTNIDLMVLGEIMMGGKVTTNLDYNYLMAFKDIYDLTKKADFTYANLSTNITNLDKIEDAKTNYLVTKNILSAANAVTIYGSEKPTSTITIQSIVWVKGV